MFAMFLDSTPQRDAERARHPCRSAPLRRDEELAALRKELAEVRAQLRQVGKVAAVAHPGASLAHEIGNPLGCVFSNFIVLQGYVEALLGIAQQRACAPHAADHGARLRCCAAKPPWPWPARWCPCAPTWGANTVRCRRYAARRSS